MSGPERIGNPEMAAYYAEVAKRLGNGKAVPTDAHGRIRSCTRCEKLREEFEKHDPKWTPAMCESWVSNGRRYWSMTCRPCGEIEAEQRRSARKALEEREQATSGQGAKPTLGMRPKGNGGPRWPWQKRDET